MERVFASISKAIPSYKEFCNLLHERLYQRFLTLEDLPPRSLMLHMNLIPRHLEEENNPQKNYNRSFFLAGADSQKRILEEVIGKNHKDFHKTENNWENLKDKSLEAGIQKLETIRLIPGLRSGNISIDELQPQYLKDYFPKDVHNETLPASVRFKNVFQENEYPIFKLQFDIDKDMFISIPMIAFGFVEGVIHILFKKENLPTFSSKDTVKRIIKHFMGRYEDLILDWDSRGDNIYRLSAELFKLSKNHFDSIETTNPLFQELGLKAYYQGSISHYQSRIESNDDIYNKLTTYARRIAIISILVDSFSHNISAHSLTALNWWFRQKASYLKLQDKKEKEKDKKELENLENELYGFEKEAADGRNPFLKIDRSLSPELHPLLRFLMEKGAFWTGVARDNMFGGLTTTLAKVLWLDFFNNPLYLGTIAFSEGISKISVSFCIYREADKTDKNQVERHIDV